MEDFFKDFEYYGFNSELEMMVKIVGDSASYSDELKSGSFNEIMKYWFDENTSEIEMKSREGQEA